MLTARYAQHLEDRFTQCLAPPEDLNIACLRAALPEGTPGFNTPEQYKRPRGRAPRTFQDDLFAVGVTCKMMADGSTLIYNIYAHYAAIESGALFQVCTCLCHVHTRIHMSY